MDQALLTAAAGMRARLESLEVLGNNIANANTAGFKADREFYNVFIGMNAEAALTGEIARMPVVQGSAIDLAQGALTPTAAPLDVALSGPGLFAVQGPAGVLYTRNGGFRLASSGRLETAEGFAVLGDNGRPINVPPGKIEISEDGSIFAAGAPAGRLRIVEFSGAAALSKAGASYFRSAIPNPTPAARTVVRQGHLEAANVNAAAAAVRLIEVTRQFEMISRAVSIIAGDMNRRAVEELPRTER